MAHVKPLTPGQRALKAARSDLSIEGTAKLYGVSQGAVSNARGLLKRGVPELVDLVERGEIRLDPAAAVSRARGQQRQRELVRKGPDAIRGEARRLRAQAEHCSAVARMERPSDLNGPLRCSGPNHRAEVDERAYLLVDGLPFCGVFCLAEAINAGKVRGDPMIKVVNEAGDRAGLFLALDTADQQI